jgi:hypothetical protein
METIERIIRCPKCRKSTAWQNNPHRPFCSARCREIDLGRWADEDYAIPGPAAPPEDENSEE